MPHQSNVDLNYQPRSHGLVLRGWAFSLSTILRSGFPLVATQDANRLGACGFSHQRPENCGVTVRGNRWSKPERYPTAGSIAPARGLRRSSWPHTTREASASSPFNWDVSAERLLVLWEVAGMSLRFDFMSLLNNANRRGPRTLFGAEDFGSIPGTRALPQTLQFMMKAMV